MTLRTKAVFDPEELGLPACPRNIKLTIEYDGSRPQWVVRAGHKHFVARVQQSSQREVDQLAYAVADENFLRGDVLDAAVLLLHDDGFPRREDTLLMTIRFGLPEVFDHRQTHGFRRTESEQSRILKLLTIN